MLKNLSIKARLVFVIGLLSVLLIGIGVMGLASLSATNASLKTVYEDRVVALGQLERISARWPAFRGPPFWGTAAFR
ncbi:MAG: Tar ligand binding domain-containing protein [Candidatus Thermoplasmatota archaeon]|nr:Tar ligand binding domain-containing protein [Candidatus Thermoplasmatota archaeon]